jgi:L-glyceraldehyde 3-phosphate reductase
LPGCCAATGHIGPDRRQRPQQIIDCVGALDNLEFTEAELAEIDGYAATPNINLWAASAERKREPKRK